MDPTELLVHISARATRRHDDHYRAQAEIYHDFQPRSRIFLTDSEKNDGFDMPNHGTLRAAVGSQNSGMEYANIGDALPNVPVVPLPGSCKLQIAPRNRAGKSSDKTSGSSDYAPSGVVLSSRDSFFTPEDPTDRVPPGSRDPMEQLETIQRHWQDNRRLLELAFCSSSPAERGQKAVSGVEKSTFIDDTQLAAAVLESQVFSVIRRDTDLEPDLSALPEDPNKRVCRSSRHYLLFAQNERADNGQERSQEDILLAGSEQTSERQLRRDPHILDSLRTVYKDAPHLDSQTSLLPSSYGLGSSSMSDSLSRKVSEQGGHLQQRQEMLSNIETTPPTASSADDPVGESHANRTPRVDIISDESSLPRQTDKHTQFDSSNLTTDTSYVPPSLPQAAIAPPSSPRAPIHTHSASIANLSEEISPFDPPTGHLKTEQNPTHVTKALAGLVNHPEIGHKYSPVYTERPLRQTERGHWRIPTSSWPLEKQISFWEYLEAFIGDGRASWPQWVTRNRNEKGQFEEREGEGLGIVQFWCWGEIVPHIWLLIYVASWGLARNVGAEWRDGSGQL